MKAPIRQGHIYWVPDSAIKLPPNDKREVHRRRPYLVMSSDAKNADESWPVVFGFPLSTSQDRGTEFDVPLPRGSAGLPEDCLVMVPLAQALAKSKLGDHTGQLDANTREAVVARLLSYFGVL